MGMSRAGLAVALCTLLVAGCRSPVSDGATAHAGPHEPVQKLLRQRAEHLNAGDLESYLRPLSPEARAFEEPIARRAVELPLGRVDLVMTDANISDDGDRFSQVAVDLIYRYTDLPDDNPFRLPLRYDIERRGGEWIVTSSAFDPALEVAPPLWATGPVVISRSEHFLAMSRPDVAGIDDALAVAERARAALLAQLNVQAEPKHMLVVARDAEEFKALTGASAIAVARAQFRSAGPGALRPVSRDIVVDLASTIGTTAARSAHQSDVAVVPPVQVFQHELAHAVLSRLTRQCTDGWVVEGAAMLLSGERRTAEWEVLVRHPMFERLSLGGMVGSSETVMYPYANAAVLYLVENFGAQKFVDFYRNFMNAREPGGGCSDEALGKARVEWSERLLRRHYRLGFVELDTLTRGYILNAVA